MFKVGTCEKLVAAIIIQLSENESSTNSSHLDAICFQIERFLDSFCEPWHVPEVSFHFGYGTQWA
jgi:hypothetical protein